MLPKNTEIEAALAEYQRLFGGETHASALSAQRRAALLGHALSGGVRAAPGGSGADGTATEHSDVQLHLFAERAESVTLKLMDRRASRTRSPSGA